MNTTIKIGNLRPLNNIFLAPMAGVTDLPFRVLCKEYGCGLLFTEMVSAKGIMYNNKNTKSLLEIDPKERPVALQLFGRDPLVLSETAKRIEEYPFDILDINMGCPVPKVVKNGEGSALLKEPRLIGEIVNALYKSIKKPITVKIRKGFDENNINATEIAKIIEQNGGSAVSIHGRTREEYYKGKADWEIIKKVKETVGIPVIGNGDVFSAEDAKKMLEMTGCDGVMIGRGAKGNPFIFREILHYLKTGENLEEPSAKEKIETLKRHLLMLTDFKGEYIGVREMRRHFAYYTKGIKYSAKIRVEVNKVETIEEFLKLLDTVILV